VTLDLRGVAAVEPTEELLSAPVLPDDYPAQRGAGFRVPCQHRLALVVEAARDDLTGRILEHFGDGRDDSLQNFLSVLLDPAGLRMTRDLVAARFPYRAQALVEEHRLDCGGAFVDTEQECHRQILSYPSRMAESLHPFERLDFIYMPSRDVAADVEYFNAVLGAEVVFAIEAFGARVAMVGLAAGPPDILLADHLTDDRPYLVYRVADLDGAMRALEKRGWTPAPRIGIPHGPCCAFETAGGHRLAIYELTRPEVRERLAGRRDF
jgi:hypothetical protein